MLDKLNHLREREMEEIGHCIATTVHCIATTATTALGLDIEIHIC